MDRHRAFLHVILTKKKGRYIKMVREFVKKHMCSITTFALTLVAAGMSSKCCYFMFYQPEVPENLKKFSK